MSHGSWSRLEANRSEAYTSSWLAIDIDDIASQPPFLTTWNRAERKSISHDPINRPRVDFSSIRSRIDRNLEKCVRGVHSTE
ncbi:hypothetical protein H4Q26_010937 [Puccinia striiformis f. sp. tritici PST-130]|uniref:Uncharacterized protein n=1 Tax=Puccinia striiformis f. sp. tritici PST-78 TaxID=1165861 RepID=A0A0L0W3K4_9BASI|nr:hypothetical protein H4Q26_010937 [Puccinia striiformis f. sp. tritici PST-130]KNF06133.1 hypothetical protein PSTG_00643 [Puccinia striiformis f. sp. tritici PST-78]